MFGIQANRFLALTAALIVMLPLSIIAARWQWSRHLERESMNQLVESNATSFTMLSPAQKTGLAEKDQYKRVRLQGHFDAPTQRLLRKQTFNGEPGFHVLTIFVTSNDERVLINRGWVASAGQSVAQGVNLQPPLQDLEIEGRLVTLEGSLQADPSDLPLGQTNSAALFAKQIDYQLMVEQIEPETLNGPTPLPLPTVEAGPHLGYVGQWILIALASVSVYITVLRNLRREGRQTAN